MVNLVMPDIIFYQYLGVMLFLGMIPFIVLLFMCMMSPALDCLMARFMNKTLLWTMVSAGHWQARRASYKHGLFKTKQGYHPAITDGTDLGTCRGMRMGVNLEMYGVCLSPYKIGVIEFWQKFGFMSIFEAELFNIYAKSGAEKFDDYLTSVKENEDLFPGVKVKAAVDVVKRIRDISSSQQVKELMEAFDKSVPHIDSPEKHKVKDLPPVYWNAKDGLVGNVSGVVTNIQKIKNFFITYLRPDLIDSSIKAGIEEGKDQMKSATATAIKFTGIGFAILLAVMAFVILLSFLNGQNAPVLPG